MITSLKTSLRFLAIFVLLLPALTAEWVSMKDFSHYDMSENIAYRNHRWVSWGIGYVFTSEDAINWKAIDVPHHWGAENLLYGNGKWVVPNSYRFKGASFSDNLEQWVELEYQNVDESIIMKSFAQNRFWASSSQPIRWYQSIDGVNWSKVPNPFHKEEVVITSEGRVIAQGDINLHLESDIRQVGHITLFENGAREYLNGEWKVDSPANLAYTVDGVNWDIVRLELKDGSVWTSDSLDPFSLNILFQYAKGATFYHGAFYRGESEGIYRVDAESNETKIDPFTQAGIEPLEYDKIRQIFQSSTRLYAGTTSGKIFQSFNGSNWELRFNPPKINTSKYINEDDNILMVCNNQNRYLLAAGADTLELVSKPEPRSNGKILTVDDAWYQQTGDGIIRTTDGQNWSWVLDVETQSGEFSGNNVHMTELSFTGKQWVAYGYSQTGSSYDEDNVIRKIVWLSSDGENWEVSPVFLDGASSMPRFLSTFNYGNGKWVGYLQEDDENKLLISEDGIDFARSGEISRAFGSEEIIFFSGVFVDSRDRGFWYSEDGINWSGATLTQPIADEIYTHGIEFHKLANRLCAFNGYHLWVTEDGKSWEQLPSPVENGYGYTTGFDHFLDWNGELFFSGGGSLLRLHNGQWSESPILPKDVVQLLNHPQTGDIWLLTEGGLMADESMLDLPRVTIEQVNGYEFFEGQTDVVAFSVKRTGDINEPLDVHLQETSSSVYGEDHMHNLEREGDHFVLHFEAGYPELHIRITTFTDAEDEYSESLGFELLPSSDYDISDLVRAHSYVVVYDPE